MTMKLFSSKHSKDHDHSINGPTGFFHRIGRDPYTDWTITFTVAVIIAVVLAFFGLLTFENALSELNGNSTPTASAAVKFDAQALTNLMAKFDARAAERAKLQKTYDGPGDPSL